MNEIVVFYWGPWGIIVRRKKAQTPKAALRNVR